MNELLAPVVKTRELGCSPDVAFTLFADRMADWWPVKTHSVAGDRVRSIVVEPSVGGHVFEVDDEGVRHDWATVVVHDPPRRLVLDWYAGRTADEATRVEVTFTAHDGGCTLRLVHDGWPATEAARHAGYVTGWEPVLDGYQAATES